MKRLRWGAYGICAVVAFVIGRNDWSGGAQEAHPFVGLHLPVANEHTASSRQSQSNPPQVVLVYSDVCPWSRAQLAHWLRLSSELSSADFVLFSLQPIEDSLVRRLDQAGINYGGTTAQDQQLSSIAMHGTPVTLLLDGSHQIRSVKNGLRPSEELRLFVSSFGQ